MTSLRLLTGAVVSLTACAPWLTVTPDQLSVRPDPREQHEVWSGDTVFVLRAVAATEDSIQGVLLEDSLHGNELHISVALADVDSLRVERQRANVVVWTAVHVAVLSFFYVVLKMLPST